MTTWHGRHRVSAVAQVHAPLADRLDLGPEQRDIRLPGLDDVVVVAGFAVFRDRALRLFALGFGSRHAYE